MRSGVGPAWRRCYPSLRGGRAATRPPRPAWGAPPARPRSSGRRSPSRPRRTRRTCTRGCRSAPRRSAPAACRSARRPCASREPCDRVPCTAVRPIDLRSDTVTRPTPEMRRAMADAPVGDDVWGDDPTVIELERETAALLGKEAALYVPSGHMGNQVAIRSQTSAGDEILVHELAHVVVHEQGACAVLSGAQTRMVSGERGMPGPDVLAGWLRDPSDVHHARQTLVCLENTVGEQGGLVYPQERIDAVAAFAHETSMRGHMDGARLWNAAVASGTDPARIVRDIDSVSVCFSKGLGAPVGSAGVGDAELLATPHRNRKLLGGGMRQAGIIAAGALHAVRHHVDRLADD